MVLTTALSGSQVKPPALPEVMTRAVNWVKNGGYLKYLDIKTLEQIDGVWIATDLQVTKKKGKKTYHKTLLKNSNVKFNQDLKVEFFSIRQMEKGL